MMDFASRSTALDATVMRRIVEESPSSTVDGDAGLEDPEMVSVDCGSTSERSEYYSARREAMMQIRSKVPDEVDISNRHWSEVEESPSSTVGGVAGLEDTGMVSVDGGSTSERSEYYSARSEAMMQIRSNVHNEEGVEFILEAMECIHVAYEFYQSSKLGRESDYEEIRKFIRDVEFVVPVLNEALEEVQTKLTESKTNCALNDTLAQHYQAGMKKISTYVQVVLHFVRARPIRSWKAINNLSGIKESLSLLLYSLAEIERSMHSGAVYTSSGAISEVEGTSSVDKCSLSMACRFMFRDFSFCLDLVQIAFNCIIIKLEVLDISENSVGQKISEDIVQDLCNSQLLNLFQWCERSCRPVLRQHVLEFGQLVLQHPSVSKVVEEVGHEDTLNHCEELKEVKIDLLRLPPEMMHIWEESGVESKYSLPPKVNIKDIQIVEYLAHGASAGVYSCKWQDKVMVVKKVMLDLEEPKFQERFEMEVAILSSLKHPNAVQIFGYGFTEEDGNFYGFILLEKMEMDLYKIIRDIKKDGGGSSIFSIDVSIGLMSQIVEGMCALKYRKVMHRDLKPANILVNRPDKDKKPFERFYEVKLADFGASKQYDVSNPIFQTRRVGTVAYMAPEAMSQSEEKNMEGYSWAADVWSFGMVCSEILTGKVPFEYLNIAQKTAAIEQGERPKLDLLDCEDPLRRLVEDCWKFDPKERPDILEVRQRLWECKIMNFLKVERPPTSWQAFCTKLRACSIESLALPVTLHIKALIKSNQSTVGPCRGACLALQGNLESIQPAVERIESQLQELCKLFSKAMLPNLKRVVDWLVKLKEVIDVVSTKVHECNSETKLKYKWRTFPSSEVLKSMQPAFVDPTAGMELQLQEYCKHDPDDKLGVQAPLRVALQVTLQGMNKWKETLHDVNIKLQENNTLIESDDLSSYQLSNDIMALNTRITELSKEQETVALLLKDALRHTMLLELQIELFARLEAVKCSRNGMHGARNRMHD